MRKKMYSKQVSWYPAICHLWLQLDKHGQASQFWQECFLARQAPWTEWWGAEMAARCFNNNSRLWLKLLMEALSSPTNSAWPGIARSSPWWWGTVACPGVYFSYEMAPVMVCSPWLVTRCVHQPPQTAPPCWRTGSQPGSWRTRPPSSLHIRQLLRILH